MGFSLHLPTLIILSIAINLMIGGLLWAIYYLRGRQYCFLLWALACGAFAMGSVLAGARAVVDAPWLTVFAAHAFLGLSPLLLLGGLLRFSRVPTRPMRWFRYAFRIAFAGYLLVLLLTFQNDPLSARLVTTLFSAIVFGFAIYCLNVSATQPALPRRVLQVLFSLHGMLMLAQCLVIAMGWFGANQIDITTNAVLQLILVNHILLATATALSLSLLAFTRSERRLRALAEKDGLTDLLNRRSFFREGVRVFEKATLDRQAMAVLMIDLDHFKQINDRWGHATGDEALQTVARILESELRDEDIIGRIGGEEFAIVLQLSEDESLPVITHRLLNAIARKGANVNGLPLNLSASIGGIERIDRHKRFAELMLEADTALYSAKNKGRNRAEFGELMSLTETV
ncbi:hypothetical protein LCGC14_0585500 [marine sediment metagenome]|uniref:diguanylate cyclase n=2 Tax=root TaxID=1 RepID=A0A831R5H2_9GAMM|nr:GGDEF domain-containing protein [Marinobacter antarcticus]HEA53292.1 GGDEF domain-containing protein [Marinobacter antarcticus]